MNEQELRHYGVVGMKWGVRRNPSKAYSKAVYKKKKLEKKAVKKNLKSAKLASKVNKRSKYAITEEQTTKLEKLNSKSTKLRLKSAKAANKARKWEKKMNKTFSEYNVKRVPGETIRSGVHFIDRYELNKV